MSKYQSFANEAFPNQECLIQALLDEGWTREQIEVHEEAQALLGIEGRERKERAHIIIRREHVGGGSNDLGFVRTDAGYVPIISEFDLGRWRKRHLERTGRHSQGFVPDMRSAYSAAVVRRVARQMRGSVKEEAPVGTTRRLVLNF